MYTEIQIRIKPEQAGVEETLRQIAARVAGVGAERICRVDIVRKSIDARQKEVMFNLVAGLHIDRIEEKEKVFVPAYRDVSDGETVVVVGAGPAGLFAALRLIERGFRPLVLERGKAVEDRKKDLNGLYKTGMVDEDSNFGFGEGGAGTFPMENSIPVRRKGEMYAGLWKFWSIMEPILLFWSKPIRMSEPTNYPE